ncbi:peroxidase-like [Adelges cooleyi]|uniref:peroxidase-like n=1 Tax=Adelges cooleyi TaxID=133065 RepID=UPI00217F93FD|nr:peroxidase-like [Adelges cooleyi]
MAILKRIKDIPMYRQFQNGETTNLLSNGSQFKNRATWLAHRYWFAIILTIFGLIFISIMFYAVDLIMDEFSYTSPYEKVESSDLNNFTLPNNDFFDECALAVSCNPNDTYRSSNGTCNNLINPNLGSSKTPFLRFDDVYYSDGASKLRLSTNGKPLPSARELQVRLFMNRQSNIRSKYNQLLMQWGQFVANDVSGLAIDINMEDCCGLKNDSWIPRACEAVIEIPADDPVFSINKQTCMTFTRALTSANYSCSMKSSSFINEATHYLDGSNVYGSDHKTASNLRSFNGGTLRINIGKNGQAFCPHTTSKSSGQNNFQYVSGDARVNLNLGLALFHNMFLRFHNYVAFQFRGLNSNWTDEKLYQETRRFVIATIQHITYTQFLPTILGNKYTNEKIMSNDEAYDSRVNPSTTQEFSSGAFRVLHNIVPARHNFINLNHTTVQSVDITDWMERPVPTIESNSNFDNLLRGMLETETRISQPSYNLPLSNLMFHRNGPLGVDLLSYDIQRGRDTGLPPYNKIRAKCGLSPAKSFDDLADVMSLDDVRDLKNVYSSVDDVDFLVGALLETPDTDAVVGNTTRCIIGDFFHRIRVGDRFFYDNLDQSGSFTDSQLEVLKSIDLGHVICATSAVDHLQWNIFTYVDNGWFSPMKWTCNERYTIDFHPWIEDHEFNE